jgi:hypothetical protein
VRFVIRREKFLIRPPAHHPDLITKLVSITLVIGSSAREVIHRARRRIPTAINRETRIETTEMIAIDMIAMIEAEIAIETVAGPIDTEHPRETTGAIDMEAQIATTITLIATEAPTTTTMIVMRVIAREAIAATLVASTHARVTSFNVLLGSRVTSLVSSVNRSSRFSVHP